jgi:hypothetical protein
MLVVEEVSVKKECKSSVISRLEDIGWFSEGAWT